MILYGSKNPNAELVILFGNCQTIPIALQLAAADTSPKGRTYGCVLNHRVPGEIQLMPTAEQLKRCVLYLEQYDSPSTIPTREMLREQLLDHCPRLIFPTFMMFCLWPFDTAETHGTSELPSFPWGRYPHGDSLGLELAADTLTREQAMEAYMQLSQSRMPDLQQRLQNDVDRIGRHDRASDIQIGDYVIPNFRQRKVFLTPGHVSNEALLEMATRIHRAIAPTLGNDPEVGCIRMERAITDYQGMSAFELPIHPSVAHELQLQYCNRDTRFNWFGHHWTFSEYIARYITYDCSWNIRPQSEHPPGKAVDIFSADIQLSAAKGLRWMPDRIMVTGEQIAVEGWALSMWDSPDSIRFLLNGQDFEHIEWPIDSPDMLGPLGSIPGAHSARFRCRQRLRPEAGACAGGTIRLNVTGRFGEHRHSYRTAWFIPGPQPEMPGPLGDGPEAVVDNATLSHCTLAERIRHFLDDRFGRPLASFAEVLDLGNHMTGHLARHCPAEASTAPYRQNIRSWQYRRPDACPSLVEPLKNLPFTTSTFDLVIGIGLPQFSNVILSHDSLMELQRIAAPGALVLISLPGMAQAALTQNRSEEQSPLQGEDANQDKNRSCEARYRTDYIYSRWDNHFEVLEIVEALAGCQDLVVMRRRGPDACMSHPADTVDVRPLR